MASKQCCIEVNKIALQVTISVVYKVMMVLFAQVNQFTFNQQPSAVGGHIKELQPRIG